MTDYLILEAYLGDDLIADLFNEDGTWKVDFMLESGRWSISYEVFTQIHQKFADFVEEMKHYQVISLEKE